MVVPCASCQHVKSSQVKSLDLTCTSCEKVSAQNNSRDRAPNPATSTRNADWRCGRVARWTNTPAGIIKVPDVRKQATGQLITEIQIGQRMFGIIESSANPT